MRTALAAKALDANEVASARVSSVIAVFFMVELSSVGGRCMLSRRSQSRVSSM